MRPHDSMTASAGLGRVRVPSGPVLHGEADVMAVRAGSSERNGAAMAFL